MTSVISRKTFSSSKYYFSNRKLNIMDGWMDIAKTEASVKVSLQNRFSKKLRKMY